MRPQFTWAILLTSALAVAGCQKEHRNFRPSPASQSTLDTVQVSGLNPGGISAPMPPPPNLYQESAYAVSQGQQLFDEYNCSGCHSNGGGGIGPALMDKQWIYGSDPWNIYTTIMQGRPNGMPSWRNRIPEYQAWELVAYVRALGNLLPKDVEPTSSSAMWETPPPAQLPSQTPTGLAGAPEQK